MEVHRTFAEEWISAWNDHDLDRILAHYSPTVTVRTPQAIAVLEDSDGIVRGLDELATYWSRALAAAPALHFELEEAFPTVDGVSILYRNHRDQRVVETVVFGPSGLVELAVVAYAGLR